MAENVEIARGVVKIDVEASSVAPALEQVKVDVQETEKVAEETTRTFKKVTKEAEASSTSAIQEASRFRAALTRILGLLSLVTVAIAGLRAAIEALGRAFADGGTRAAKFAGQLDFSDSEASLKAVNAQIDALRKKVENRSIFSTVGNAITDGLLSGAEDELEQLNAYRVELAASAARKAAEAEKVEADKKRAEEVKESERVAKEIESIELRMRDARNAVIEDDRERMIRQKYAEIFDLDRLADRTQNFRLSKAIRDEANLQRELLELAIQRYDRDREAAAASEREKANETVRAAREAADRASAAVSVAVSNAMDEINRRLADTGIERIAGTVEAIAGRLEAIARAAQTTRRL